MRRLGRYIIVLLLLLSGMASHAQNPNNLIATKRNLVLLIDLNSPQKDIDTILKRAAITGVDVKVFVKGDFSALIKDGWIKVTQKNNIVQFNRPLKNIRANAPENPFVITGDIIKGNNRNGYMDNAIYGINNFKTATVYELPNGLTRFVLPGNLNAKRVFLSGSFNDWSTLKGKMTKTATGWILDEKLESGAYMYKFIVNSNWTTDPNNSINLDDGGGNTNSVYYKYNHTFKLRGFTSAQKVYVTGSFNKWRMDELPLQKTGDGWECPIYLHEGTYAYRFIVDGKSMADPANHDNYKDDDGAVSSVVDIGSVVYFKLDGYPNAHSVHVAGNFNNWNPDGLSMKRSGNTWLLPLTLASGNYKYKFIVDGDWITDPANPVQVVEDKQVNSFLAVNPNHTFRLAGYKEAHVVHLAGTFNDWNPNEYLMGHTGNDWSISMYLKPGKYLYKFIVDDNWMIDPENKQWEQNKQNTGNSVLWME